MREKIIAIIPARGGSKRIPRKNVKEFLGKPIICYSIEAALESNIFDEVMVSTEDDEIKEIALAHGAKVPFMRSVKSADDMATTMDVINEVLRTYENEKQTFFQYACCIYPTAPLVCSNDLKQGLKKIRENGLTSVFPVTAFEYPIWRGITIDENGLSKMLWPENCYTRSQDLTPVFHDAGQWYWYDPEKIKDWQWPNDSGTIILNEEYVQDIDTIADWKLAEIKYKLLKCKEEKFDIQ